MSAVWDTKSVKVTPTGLDEILIIDTANSRNQKRATLTSLGATHWNRNAGSGFIFPTNISDNVGIGTGGPSEKLEVLGNIKVSGGFIDIGRITIPADPGADIGRAYVKQIDANNDGVFVKIKKAGVITEVQVG